MKRIIVADIGGTSIKTAFFTDGSIQKTASIPTHACNGAEDVMERLIQLLSGYPKADAIGISTCGSVNRKEGSIHFANENMPGYTGMQVQKIMEEKFSVPCAVENDAICAAIGEKTYGSAKDLDDFIMLTYGTGVGAGIYLNGKPYYGKGFNTSPYVGGIYVRPLAMTAEPRDCTYETNASTTALVRMAERIDPSVQEARTLFEKEQSEEMKRVIHDWCRTVACGLCSITHLYNVPALVLGGGILEQESVFLDIRSCFEKYLESGFDGTFLRKARLGNQAGLYGALHIAEEKR